MMKPVIMGTAMGVMMLWMLHGALTGSGVTGFALIAFLGVHVLIAAVLIGAAVFAARLSPRMKSAIDRLHRPSLRHITTMLAAAIVTAMLVHLTVHGGLV